MKISVFHLLVIVTSTVLCAIVVESAQCPGSLNVIEHPQQVVGYTGERVSYECTICGGTLYWEVNGTSLNHFDGEPYYLEEHEGNPGELSVIALPSLNNTIVQCIAFSSGTDVYSEPVPILVQGKLDAPTNLSSDIENGCVSLSWTPPYTMPTTNMTFEIAILVDSRSNFLKANTSSPGYTLSYSVLNISRDLNRTIEFTVCAVNPAGHGENASIGVTIPAQSLDMEQTTGEMLQYMTVDATAAGVAKSGLSSERSSGVMLHYVAIGVAAAAAVILLLLIVLSVTCFICCYSRSMKGKDRVKEVQADVTDHLSSGELPDVKMHSNSCYVTTQMKRNVSYEEPPHLYEEIKVNPKARSCREQNTQVKDMTRIVYS